MGRGGKEKAETERRSVGAKVYEQWNTDPVISGRERVLLFLSLIPLCSRLGIFAWYHIYLYYDYNFRSWIGRSF